MPEPSEIIAARLAAIVQSSDDAIVSKTLDGVITSWNGAAERMFGYTAAEAIGRHITLIVPDDRRAEEEDVLARIRRGEGVSHFETIRVTKDGRRLFISLTVSPVRDSQGRIVGASKIARDVTEQKRIEAERVELLARERDARALAQAAERRSTFLARASATLASSLDYDRMLAEATNLAVPEIADGCTIDLVGAGGELQRVAVAHRDPAAAAQMWRMWTRRPWNQNHPILKVVRTGRPEICEDVSEVVRAQIAHDADHERMLAESGLRSYIAVPLRARGVVLGVLGLVRAHAYGAADVDLAEELAQRVAQAIDNACLYRESQAANRAKDQFLAVLSHELRTPLNAVFGWARMLQSRRLDEASTTRAVDAIVRNAGAQVQLIDDLLDMSRVITGKMRLDVRSVDLAAVVENALDAVRPAAAAKAIRLESVLDPRAGPVSGDPERLQQVLWNLLMNAVKFTPKSGRVQVELKRLNSHVEIVVADTGQGIAADVLPFVFDRFRQGDSSPTRSHSGLGLGLALVKHLVELHGGTVEAASPGEGKGATFLVKLPLAIAEVANGAAPGEHPTAATLGFPAPRVRLTGLRVLVVDDDADGIELASAILVGAGAVVRTSRSVAEALDVLRDWRAEVVVSDIEMPGEDGYALIRRLRALPPEHGGATPAVALTAYGRREDRMRTLAAGYVMHIAKPVDPAELTTIVASVAGRLPASE